MVVSLASHQSKSLWTYLGLDFGLDPQIVNNVPNRRRTFRVTHGLLKRPAELQSASIKSEHSMNVMPCSKIPYMSAYVKLGRMGSPNGLKECIQGQVLHSDFLLRSKLHLHKCLWLPLTSLSEPSQSVLYKQSAITAIRLCTCEGEQVVKNTPVRFAICLCP